MCFDGWLKELQEHKQAIPQNFDLAFFSEAFQVMLEAEHHQILSRILSLLYDSPLCFLSLETFPSLIFASCLSYMYSELFQGDLRQRMFGDFLMKRFFFRLFLYWDYNIRNIFHQLIIFKVPLLASCYSWPLAC
jgi:hypothetical protein